MSRIEYLYLPDAREPPTLPAQPFRAVIVAEITVDAEWRSRVSDWLVASGCLYAVCWGIDCAAWEDSIDWSELAAADFKDVPDDRLVMTTAHADESLTDALWFAAWAAHHPTVELGQTLIVHVANADRASEILEAYAEAQRDEG
ncbi:hypothetical protein GVN24_34075 [Rhizobium sp. CRIBSB]|nr:hypothetical protein [Rhizobium sp. CRIBSB]